MMLKPAKVSHRPANCYEIHSDMIGQRDAVYHIYPDPDSEAGVKVYCEMNRGGWTRIFNRINKSPVAFDRQAIWVRSTLNSFQNDFILRTWNEYKTGFGDINGNYWIGLNEMQKMTFRNKMVLRIELWNTKTDHQFIEYDSFLVYSEENDFKVEVGKSDRATLVDWFAHHSGNIFGTKDRGNFNKTCSMYKGAWWFGINNKVCLTCTQDIETWGLSGDESMIYTFAKMMIRPAQT